MEIISLILKSAIIDYNGNGGSCYIIMVVMMTVAMVAGTISCLSNSGSGYGDGDGGCSIRQGIVVLVVIAMLYNIRWYIILIICIIIF